MGSHWVGVTALGRQVNKQREFSVISINVNRAKRHNNKCIKTLCNNKDIKTNIKTQIIKNNTHKKVGGPIFKGESYC